jgi:hypothetical protein
MSDKPIKPVPEPLRDETSAIRADTPSVGDNQGVVTGRPTEDDLARTAGKARSHGFPAQSDQNNGKGKR